MFKEVFGEIFRKDPYSLQENNKPFNFSDNQRLGKYYIIKINEGNFKLYSRDFTNWNSPVLICNLNNNRNGFELNGFFRRKLFTRLFFAYGFGFGMLWIFCTSILLIIIVQFPLIILFPVVGIIIFYFNYKQLQWAAKKFSESINEIKMLLDNAVKDS
ncbi:MAG: hypothetical protein EHM44_08585 [Ignavibacteriales bacterium]|nr:MAG: hypothetical protein EHM44_08585 [Ignavibacteriales bacterium]